MSIDCYIYAKEICRFVPVRQSFNLVDQYICAIQLLYLYQAICRFVPVHHTFILVHQYICAIQLLYLYQAICRFVPVHHTFILVHQYICAISSVYLCICLRTLLPVTQYSLPPVHQQLCASPLVHLYQSAGLPSRSLDSIETEISLVQQVECRITQSYFWT